MTRRLRRAEDAAKATACLSERLAAEAAALQESGARTAADLVALRAEVSELSALNSERADALAKELMLQQEDFTAVKAAIAKLSSSVESFVERLDRQADALRSTFAAYSQRETQLEQLVDGLTRLRTLPAPPAASTLSL
jgi:chromosome segregation ATPase